MNFRSNADIQVATIRCIKSSYKDLVTTVDKENDQYISTRLHEIDPGSRVVSEEGFGDEVATLTGHVWIVDPIDGTMNFVMQHANFYIMIALYVDGKPTLGYIMDVIDGTVYHGGKKRGVFENNRRLTSPASAFRIMSRYLGSPSPRFSASNIIALTVSIVTNPVSGSLCSILLLWFLSTP